MSTSPDIMPSVDGQAAMSPGASRRFLRALAAGAAFALLALIALRFVPLPARTISDAAQRGILDVLPSDEIAAVKIRFAEERPRLDIGLFGNSRILMIGREELGLPGTIFNFAIPGQSVRQSIHMLEALKARDKAPKIAVISMDYVELGLPGGAGIYPGIPTRWFEELDDTVAAWRQAGAHTAAAATINALAIEGQQFALSFNRTYLANKLAALAGTPWPGNYRSDGSRKEQIPTGAVDIGTLPQRTDRYALLESDFSRIAAVRDAGTRIIVYESPINPVFAIGNGRELSANARQVRERFEAACARFRLECHGPPALAEVRWFDRDHAPAHALGAWLRRLIAPRT